jgi:hypothetical protein
MVAVRSRYHEETRVLLTICSEKIDARELILDPCSFQENASGPTWIDIQSCAWCGPVDLLTKKPLAEVPEYRNNRKLSKLFCEILDIEDTTWIDYLEMVSNLRRQTESSSNLPEKILRLYYLLLNDGRSTPDWTQIRYVIMFKVDMMAKLLIIVNASRLKD